MESAVQEKSFDKFTVFNGLPKELRLKIWRTTFIPRIIMINRSASCAVGPQLTTLSVNSESRQETLLYYKILMDRSSSRSIVYFNPSLDSLSVHNSRGASIDITNGKVNELKTQFVDLSYTIGVLLEKQPHVAQLIESINIPNPSVDPFFARMCSSIVSHKSPAEMPRICGLFGLRNLREIVVIPGHDLAAFRTLVEPNFPKYVDFCEDAKEKLREVLREKVRAEVKEEVKDGFLKVFQEKAKKDGGKTPEIIFCEEGQLKTAAIEILERAFRLGY